MSFRTAGFATLTDSLTVVSASSDGSVKAWNPHALPSSEPNLIGLHGDYVRCIAHRCAVLYISYLGHLTSCSAVANSAGLHRDHSTIASKSGTSMAPAKPIRLPTSSHPTPQHPNHPSTLLPRTTSDTLLLRDHRNASSDYGTPEPANALANSSDIPTIFALFLFPMMPAT